MNYMDIDIIIGTTKSFVFEYIIKKFRMSTVTTERNRTACNLYLNSDWILRIRSDTQQEEEAR